MKKVLITLAFIILAVCAHAKSALIVISHGSPMPEWRKPVLDLEPMLKQKLREGKLPGISYVRVAMMEFTEPTVATVISDCEKQGIDTVFAIPLFIAPSSHSDQDIPTIIGHKFDVRTVEELKEEGTKMVHTKMPIILGPTLSFDNILEKIMVDNVKSLSKNADNEALLFISHGDKQWTSFWQHKMASISDTCQKATGIKAVDYKFVAMGYKMVRELTPVLIEYAKTKKRILIQGVYLTSTAEDIANMGIREALKESTKDTGAEIVYSSKGILPTHSEEIIDWIVQRTSEWVNTKY